VQSTCLFLRTACHNMELVVESCLGMFVTDRLPQVSFPPCCFDMPAPGNPCDADLALTWR
jgi:hypothetical protein